ncbi:MAG TPA: hypothetical protein VJV05_09210 [Pyrinomonadaceae bacterium]|nr:hypothetical protein [Pyrinomonadaceae bacterium]
MRQGTLLVVSFLIAFPLVYFGRELLASYGYSPTYLRQTGTGLFASFVLAPIISILLTPFNKKLLAWRKTHGRDIEEEESYETDHGMIRLHPNDND